MLRDTRRGMLHRLAAGIGLGAYQARGGCLTRTAVRWIVPHAVGGGFDTYSRLLEPYLEHELGVSIQVDSIPGAGGLLGAKALRDAAPDGGTLGILSFPGLLAMAFAGAVEIDPVTSFTPLGRVGAISHVWATGADAGLRSFDELLERAKGRGLVFGVNSATSVGFLTPAVATSLLGWRAQFVAGYARSQEKVLATIRGEVDLVSLSWDVMLDHARAGDLRPMVAVDSKEAHPMFRGLPVLGGPNGLVARSAPEKTAEAEALVRFTGAGRVIAAPAGLEPEVRQCLEQAVCKALSDPKLAAAGELPLQAACAEETRRDVSAAHDDVRLLAPIVRQAVAKLQG